MKKILAIALILCLLLAIVACGGKENEETDAGDGVSNETTLENSDTEPKTEDGEKSEETLEGGMTLVDDEPKYGTAQYPDAD